jgi:hypothetical protein
MSNVKDEWKIKKKERRKERAKAHSHKKYTTWHRKEKDWQIIRIIVGQLMSMYLIFMSND